MALRWQGTGTLNGSEISVGRRIRGRLKESKGSVPRQRQLLSKASEKSSGCAYGKGAVAWASFVHFAHLRCI